MERLREALAYRFENNFPTEFLILTPAQRHEALVVAGEEYEFGRVRDTERLMGLRVLVPIEARPPARMTLTADDLRAAADQLAQPPRLDAMARTRLMADALAATPNFDADDWRVRFGTDLLRGARLDGISVDEVARRPTPQTTHSSWQT
jgi:hypothetical protein